MKKILISLAVSVLLSTALLAQGTSTSTTPSTPVNPNAPVMKFMKTTHDYGTIVRGADGSCEFKFTNTGVEPLILSNCASSCGCTVPEWPREPILKGKSASIKVKYDTNRVGPINKTVTVMSNASNSPIQLRIIGTVNQPATGTEKQGAAPVAK